MQLIIVSLAFFFLVLTQDVKAQFRKSTTGNQKDLTKGDSTKLNQITFENPDWKTIDLDFLSSYYAQDGNNSPVTGGIGTEQLTDFTQKIILSVPINKKLRINLDGGYDYYSSASTDNIDNIRSSDSSSDVRIHGNGGFSYQLNDQQTLGLRIGGSAEYDYYSVNGGLTYGWLTKDQNTSINLGLQAFFDTWIPYYPIELRGRDQVTTDQRKSYNASLGISRVLNKKMQLSLQMEGVYMTGLLSTPFHRVYFQEQTQAKLEKLPSSRLKIPIGLRFNAFISEHLVARSYYRFYWDDWGIKGHTLGIELPVKINRFFSVYPFYRYHTQSAADYFQPYKTHSVQSEFYTSDFDLSALSSHTYGIGLSYSPLNGIANIKLPFRKRSTFSVKSIDLKYSHYTRSTGMTGDIISLGIGFSF